MGPLGLVEPQCPSDRVEDVVGDAVDVPLFQTHIPLGTHPGEHRDFFAAQAWHPSTAPARRQADLLRSQLGAARSKEFTDRGSVVGRLHGFNATATFAAYGGCVDPPYKRALPCACKCCLH